MIDQLYEILLLLGTTLVAFRLLPVRFAWTVLLVSSYWLFISLDPNYWWVLPALSLWVYGTALGLERTETTKWLRSTIFFLSIAICLAPLIYFKYSDFSEDDRLIRILLPLGISFYTFQAISYLYDIYKNRINAYRHAGLVALYIAFFPHLLAGPIVRAEDLIPQLRSPRANNWKDWSEGTRLIFFGLFKKFAVANNIALFVSSAFALPDKFQGLPILIAAVLFRYQLYFDFSGYTDIAIGAGRLFGVDLPPNFNNPFAATSVSDYWRRWHMTMVSWFRDHVYFPLCRAHSRFTLLKRVIPVTVWIRCAGIVTMVCVALWHNASWNWILFGLITGILLVLDGATATARALFNARMGLTRFPRILRGWAIVNTFLLMCIPSLAALSEGTHGYIENLRGILFPSGSFLNFDAFQYFFENEQRASFFGLVLTLIVFVEIVHGVAGKSFSNRWEMTPAFGRYAIYAAAMALFVGVADMDNLNFIYFQF